MVSRVFLCGSHPNQVVEPLTTPFVQRDDTMVTISDDTMVTISDDTMVTIFDVTDASGCAILCRWKMP